MKRPSDVRLAAALHEAGLDEMAKRAEQGHSQYQSMRFRNWQKVILEHCQWDGIKRAVKRRLRRRCPSDPEDELDWKAGQLWPTMASSIEPAEIEVETYLVRQPDLDSIARRSATALRRRDAALRHIDPDAKAQSRDVQEAARVLGQQVSIFNAGSEHDIDAVFAALGRQRITSLLIVADPFFISPHAQLAALTARHNVPAIYATRDFANSGGLVSYGSRIPDGYRQAGIYVGQILKGSKPADLPGIQPTKFELVLDLKTAKSLGLTVPPSLLARADEVIE